MHKCIFKIEFSKKRLKTYLKKEKNVLFLIIFFGLTNKNTQQQDDRGRIQTINKR